MVCRPWKSSSSSASVGTGSARRSASSRYASSTSFVSDARSRTSPLPAISITTDVEMPATGSAAYAVSRRVPSASSSSRCSRTRRTGDQSRPLRDPAMPGRPSHPDACSGRTGWSTTTSVGCSLQGGSDAVTSAAGSSDVRSPRSAPQCTTRGRSSRSLCSTRLVPAARRCRTGGTVVPVPVPLPGPATSEAVGDAGRVTVPRGRLEGIGKTRQLSGCAARGPPTAAAPGRAERPPAAHRRRCRARARLRTAPRAGGPGGGPPSR